MINSDIPETWSTATLFELGEWSGGGTPSKTVNEYWNGDIPWVSPKDMKHDAICDSADHITVSAINNSAAKLIPCNSILFVTRSGILAHTLPVAIAMVPVTINQDVKALTPAHGIEPRYLAWLLRAKERQILETCSKDGTTVNSIETARIQALTVPIAPQNEQHRIVAKIEELFSELDKGIESLKTAQAQLELYRQTLLKHAFEGKLTAQWRADNPDKLEGADVILKRIEQDRAQRYHEKIAEWEAQGKRGGKPRAPGPVAPLAEKDSIGLPTLPDGWTWVRLEVIQSLNKYAVKAGPFGSALKKDSYTHQGYKIYGQEQVIRGDHAYGEYFISDAKFSELSSCSVKPQDVLISLVGTIGKVLVLPMGAAPGIINPRLVKISLDLDVYRPEFFQAYFESGFLRSMFESESQGTTMDILNLGMIKRLPYPLCSLAEQHALLTELETAFSEADKLDEILSRSIVHAEALRQSILKKAFSGQLVPHDANDEPASVLLERIKAAKALPARNRKIRES